MKVTDGSTTAGSGSASDAHKPETKINTGEMTEEKLDYEAKIVEYNMFEGSSADINFMSSALEMR